MRYVFKLQTKSASGRSLIVPINVIGEAINWPSFWGIFRVDASTKETAKEDFTQVADILNCPKTIDGVRRTLSNLEPKNDWLLILDNADNPDTDYQDYIPPGNRGAIIMTSRNPKCGFYGTSGHEELDRLKDEECLELFRKSAQLPDMPPPAKDYAMGLIKILGHHTLAILHAGTFIAHSGISISEYAGLLDKSRLRLLGKFTMGQGKSRYETVYATIEASMEFLRCQNADETEPQHRDAVQLLQILSTLHYESAPLDMIIDAWRGGKKARMVPEENKLYSDALTAWHVEQAPDLVGTDDAEMRISEAVTRLESLALVRRDQFEREWRSVSMHPLVHGWAWDRQNEKGRKTSIRMGECTVVLARYYEHEWRTYYSQFGPHLKRLVDLDTGLVCDAAQSRYNLQIFVQIAWLFVRLGLDKDMYKLSIQIFQNLKLNNEEPTEDLRELYRLVAMASEEGDPARAVTVYEAIKRLDEERPQKKTKGWLWNLRDLGGAYRANGQTKKAVALLEEVVHAQEHLGEEHREMLDSQHKLAGALGRDGRHVEAIALFEKVVSIRNRLLPRNHPDRLASERYLGVAYLRNGQLAEASRVLEDVAQRDAQIRGEGDRLTARTRAWLAKSYRDTGRLSEAIKLYERVLSVRKSQLGETDTSLLTLQHNLANALLEAGRGSEAVDLLEQVVRVEGTLYGQDDDRGKASKDLLARAYKVRDGPSSGCLPETASTAVSTQSDPHTSSTDTHVSTNGNMEAGDEAQLQNSAIRSHALEPMLIESMALGKKRQRAVKSPEEGAVGSPDQLECGSTSREAIRSKKRRVETT